MAKPSEPPSSIPEDVARFAEAQVNAGRFSSVGEVLRAGVEAIRLRDELEAERVALLRAAWDHGIKSLKDHGPQLENDADFEAFLDECEADSARQ
ncbi:MAG TPA: type II toxin-antitoxin system ParD family antitoxin [Polyangiaceae bacterium]|nr:type II toxin-antitoxin system ParD family antitoxin [Polyangiaceae bacterium]